MPVQKIIDDIVRDADRELVATLLQRGLRLDNRVAWKDAVKALAHSERYAVDCVLESLCAASSHSGNLSIAFRPHGRLYLLPRAVFDANAEWLKLLTHVELNSRDIEVVEQRRQGAFEALEVRRSEICAELERLSFDHVCRHLSYVAEHMAPLVYYVGERCISNFYDVGKSCTGLEVTLSEVLGHVMARRECADIDALTAVFCLHVALCSGNYTRLEELNSQQLSIETLNEFFDEKRIFYERNGGCAADIDFDNATLQEKATELARLRDVISGRKRFIRLICGVNLSKREGILPIPPTSTKDRGAAPSVHLPSDSELRARLEPLCIDELLKSPEPCDQQPIFASRLEALIDQVVAEAVSHTRSDFGMTRSVRDFRRFAAALDCRQAAAACAWSQAEYFCHVVPSTSVLKELSRKSLFMTTNAVSARMRYNTWHYVPSYFDPSDVPAERAWFAAPRMADIADDSDQHHTGHVHAAVRYSIRSPLPLRIGSQILPGFIDLRLMRQSGDPYSEKDLTIGIAYTETLQHLYQNLMDYLLAGNSQFIFSFGDKSWFERVYSPRATGPIHASSASLAIPAW